MTLKEVKNMLEEDGWFDDEQGREDLEDLAEWIESNLNDI